MAKCKLNEDILRHARDYHTLSDRIAGAIASDERLAEAMQESGINDLFDIADALAYAALRNDACVVARSKKRKK